jgi:HEAT repeat protein
MRTWTLTVEASSTSSLSPSEEANKDTAAELRAVCAAGMVRCATAMEALTCFVDLLADPCRPARIGAAQAIAALGHWEGVPLLRLKLQVGDPEPEVIGECCAALLELEPGGGIELVLRLLASRDTDVRVQAALALGESRHPQGLTALCQCWETERELSVRGLLLTCIGLLRSQESREFLVSLVKEDSSTAGADAIRALAPYSMIEELREQVEQAVAASSNDQLRAVFDDEFAEPPV